MRTPSIQLRRVCKEDRKAIWTWLNDPRIRRHSSKEANWEAHCRWFENLCQDPQQSAWIGLIETVRLGVARFQLRGAQADASFFIRPAYCGKGLAQPFIDQACRRFLDEHPGKSLQKGNHEDTLARPIV